MALSRSGDFAPQAGPKSGCEANCSAPTRTQWGSGKPRTAAYPFMRGIRPTPAVKVVVAVDPRWASGPGDPGNAWTPPWYTQPHTHLRGMGNRALRDSGSR